MKSPRELLLERHRSMERKLDAIRQTAIADLEQKQRASSAKERAWWAEFFVSIRWHLAGLAAAWLLVAFLNSESSAETVAKVAQETPPAPRQFVTALRENRRQLRELMEIPAAEAAPAPEIVPQRRGEAPSTTAMA